MISRERERGGGGEREKKGSWHAEGNCSESSNATLFWILALHNASFLRPSQTDEKLFFLPFSSSSFFFFSRSFFLFFFSFIRKEGGYEAGYFSRAAREFFSPFRGTVIIEGKVERIFYTRDFLRFLWKRKFWGLLLFFFFFIHIEKFLLFHNYNKWRRMLLSWR